MKLTSLLLTGDPSALDEIDTTPDAVEIERLVTRFVFGGLGEPQFRDAIRMLDAETPMLAMQIRPKLDIRDSNDFAERIIRSVTRGIPINSFHALAALNLPGIPSAPRNIYTCPRCDYSVAILQVNWGDPPECPTHHIPLVRSA